VPIVWHFAITARTDTRYLTAYFGVRGATATMRFTETFLEQRVEGPFSTIGGMGLTEMSPPHNRSETDKRRPVHYDASSEAG